MAEQIHRTYPYKTELADWPEASLEACHIREGAEVFITGPKRAFDDSGVMHFPVHIRTAGCEGSPPWDRVRARPETATIYFIGPKDGPIKIGYASRLSARLNDLRLANAYPLECWAEIEGPPALEREYHRRFAAHRLHGEWFERVPEIEAEIAALSPTPLTPGAAA